MGPNGSGKSTLAQVLAGHPAYAVTAGTVLYQGKDLLAMAPEARAREGVFLAFQYPVAIRGITNAYFLRSAVNAIRKYRGEEEFGPVEFMDALAEKLQAIGWDDSYLSRPVRSEEHTSELQSRLHLVCRLLLEKKKNKSELDTD